MAARQAARPAGGFFILWLLLSLAGCATPQTDRLLQSASSFPEPVELTAVPFFPQEEYQCGPAALAMALNWSGLATTPDALVPQVYLPARQGSLQDEMLAAARRHGRVPYVLRPQLESLLAEVASGHPVIVLQNLALTWYPKWHYAVVVGFDLARGEITLRSGLEARHTVALATFEHTWARGDYWAVAVLPPDRLPRTAEEARYLETVVALERLQRWEESGAAYAAALKRWPKSLTARLGLGNSRYRLGDVPGARAAFEQATRDHPESAPAFNNLAHTLMELGELKKAEAAARRAVELGGPHLATSRATLAEIEARRAGRQR
jgi:tetratricopeptide (TPR) repeat protein